MREITPRVAVIIVNWNGEKYLERCLSSLQGQTIVPHEVILVDNASTDRSIEIVRRFQNVRLLVQTENLGFARGNNLAIRAVSAEVEWIALLNPDAFAEPDWLANLLAAAAAHPDTLVFGSRQMKFGVAGVLDGIGDVYHVSGLVWRNGYGREQDASDDIGREIFSPCACAALYRRDALAAVGGFDEDYFCYVEDVDLGFRLRLAGYSVRYVPDAIVHHVGSGTSGGQHSAFSVYHGYRNVIWTYVKNMPGWLFWAVLPLHVLANGFILARFYRLGLGKVIMRAQTDAVRGIPAVWRKRRDIQKHRIASVTEVLRMLDKRFPRSIRNIFSRVA